MSLLGDGGLRQGAAVGGSCAGVPLGLPMYRGCSLPHSSLARPVVPNDVEIQPLMTGGFLVEQQVGN